MHTCSHVHTPYIMSGRTGLTMAEREKLPRRRRENRILEEERELLEDAAASFATQSR